MSEEKKTISLRMTVQEYDKLQAKYREYLFKNRTLISLTAYIKKKAIED